MNRAAFTLLELVVVCAIIGVVVSIAAPRVRGTLDSLAVDAAARDVVHGLALGRLAALRDGGAEVRLDSTGVAVFAGGQEVFRRRIAATHGVTLRATPPTVRYAATGRALGLSNGSIVVSRGRAADTVVVSRLGRVRR